MQQKFTLNRSLSTPNPKEEHPCHPMFWLKKFIPRGIQEKNLMEWNKVIQLTMDTDLERNFYLYLKRCFENGMINPPCYLNDEDMIRKYLGDEK